MDRVCVLGDLVRVRSKKCGRLRTAATRPPEWLAKRARAGTGALLMDCRTVTAGRVDFTVALCCAVQCCAVLGSALLECTLLHMHSGCGHGMADAGHAKPTTDRVYRLLSP